MAHIGQKLRLCNTRRLRAASFALFNPSSVRRRTVMSLMIPWTTTRPPEMMTEALISTGMVSPLFVRRSTSAEETSFLLKSSLFKGCSGPSPFLRPHGASPSLICRSSAFSYPVRSTALPFTSDGCPSSVRNIGLRHLQVIHEEHEVVFFRPDEVPPEIVPAASRHGVEGSG
ncbi:MAG: hypothetical protein MZV70_16760 [Desulfobacterales bacterium]|nr:hypothetical protein [Desulfobacterales bacterium]